MPIIVPAAPAVAAPTDLARLRTLAGEDRDGTTYSDGNLAERLTRLRCPERTDPYTLLVTAEHPDVYGAAAEVWEEKALALLPAPGVEVGGGTVKSERTGDVSLTYAEGKSYGPTDYFALARRMARRSCSYAGGVRSVDLLPAGPRRSLTLTLTTYDVWYDAVMAAQRHGIAPYDEAVINRAEPRL